MARPSSIICPVTDEQLNQIDTLIAQTHQTRSEWLQELVHLALSQAASHASSSFAKSPQPPSPPHSSTVSRPDNPFSSPAIDSLEEDEPDEVLSDFLEPGPSLDQPSSHSSQSGNQDSSPLSPNIYEAEDEPDEILYDFLDEAERPF